MGVIYIVLIILYFIVTQYGWQIRKELKRTDYWKNLLSGKAVFGYCLLVLLFVMLSSESVKNRTE